MSRSFLPISLLATAMALAPGAHAQTALCQPFQAGDPTEQPSAERAAEALRDSIDEGLRQALVRRAAQAGVEPTGIVAVEIQDQTSGRARALTFAGPMTAELAQAVIDEAAADVARWPRRADLRGQPEEFFTIRLDPLQQAETVPGQTYTECVPSLRDPGQLMRQLDGLNRRWRPTGRMSVEVRFLLSRDGRVTYGRVVRGPVTPEQANELLEMLRTRIRFRPASVAGVPTDVWVTYPFVFEPGR